MALPYLDTLKALRTKGLRVTTTSSQLGDNFNLNVMVRVEPVLALRDSNIDSLQVVKIGKIYDNSAVSALQVDVNPRVEVILK